MNVYLHAMDCTRGTSELTLSLSGSEPSPDDPAIGCDDTFDERGTIMSAECTGCMDLVPQTRQKDLS